jgi:hypothetical protein
VTRRERLAVGAAFAGLAVAAVLWSLDGLSTQDEAWFLQVTNRVAGGEALYRDVFYGATPLAVWAAVPLVWLLGAQVLWIKALVVACFVGELALLAVAARRLGAGALELVLLGAALLVWSPPYDIGLYQPLATLLLLACLVAALAWRDDPGRTRALVLAGALAGLAFCAKQNVGAYAALALAAAVVLAGPAGRRLRALGLAAASFAGAVVLALVPVAATGGLPKLWEYGFAAKGAYTDRGAISYRLGVDLQLSLVRRPVDGLVDAGNAVVHAYDLVLYALVPAALAALVVAWARSRGEERGRVLVVGLFAVAAAAAIFPRADTAHLSFVFPVLLLAGWYAARLLVDAPGLRVAAAVVLVALAPVVVARAAWPPLQLAQGDTGFSGLPNARGVLVEPAVEEEIEAAAARLRAATGPVFLGTPEAGILYLTSGLENPTPYDFPVATALGRHGEAALAAAVEGGRFETVCVDFGLEGPLVPDRLAAAIDRTLEPGDDLGVCRLYVRG